MSYNLAPQVRQQFFDNNGVALAGGKVYTYQAGTTTPLATYTDSTGATPNTNPVILDSTGTAAIWLGGSAYKIVINDALGNLIETVDNIQTPQANAFNTISPMTSLGDLIYGSAGGAAVRLAGNSTSTKQFLTQTGTGTISAAPAWGSITTSDLPSTVVDSVAFGSSPNANGALISSQVLTLEPADGTHPGGVSTSAQTFGGSKTLGAVASDATTIGAAASTAQHKINGGVQFTTNAVSGSYAVDNSTTDYILDVDVSAGVSTITLPAPSVGRVLIIKDYKGNSTANNITISHHSTEKIDGANTLTLGSNYTSTALFSDGTNWFTFGGGSGGSSPLTTKGDLYGHAAADVRIPVGSDGQSLISDSSNTNGVRWQDRSPKNYIINADAEIDTSGWAAYSNNQTMTVTIASPAVFTINSTTLWFVGMPIQFITSGALPTGLAAGTTYYVSVISSGTTFQVSATQGGSSVNTSGSQSGTHTVMPYSPVTGATGGGNTAVSGIALSRSTLSPLAGSASFTLVQSNSTVVMGQGASYDFNIDSAKQASSLAVSFDFNASSTFSASSGQSGSDSDIEVYIFDKTNSSVVQVSPKVITANGANNYQFKGTFQAASNSTSYRLIFHVATSNANATGWTFKFDNVFVGPQAISYGTPVTDWAAYTPTFTNLGTVSNVNVQYRRVGGNAEVQGYFTAGAPSASPIQISLPPGLSLDTSKISGSQQNCFGYLERFSAAANSFAGPNIGPFPIIDSTATNTTNVFVATANNGVSGYSPTNGTLFASGDGAHFRFTVPVTSWSSSVQMSNDADTRVVSLQAHLASNYAASTNAVVKFDTADYDSHAGYSTSTGLYTVPVSGQYRISANINTTSAAASFYLVQNGASVKYLGTSSSSAVVGGGSVTVSAKAGDTFGIYTNSAFTAQGSSVPYLSNLSIERLSGPAAIAASTVVAASYYSTSNISTTANAVVPFPTKLFDTTGSYNTSTSLFTCPISGIYEVSLNGISPLVNTSTYLSLFKNNVYYNNICLAQNNSNVYSGTLTAQCIAGDTLSIYSSSNAGLASLAPSGAGGYYPQVTFKRLGGVG